MEIKAEPILILWEPNKVEPTGTLNNRVVFKILNQHSGFIIQCSLFKINDDLAEEYGIIQSATLYNKPKMRYPRKEDAICAAQEYFNKYWLMLTKLKF